MGYMKEFGRAGQKRTGGIFYEEFLPELQGKKGIETYREMADNDDVHGTLNRAAILQRTRKRLILCGNV